RGRSTRSRAADPWARRAAELGGMRGRATPLPRSRRRAPSPRARRLVPGSRKFEPWDLLGRVVERADVGHGVFSTRVEAPWAPLGLHLVHGPPQGRHGAVPGVRARAASQLAAPSRAPGPPAVPRSPCALLLLAARSSDCDSVRVLAS